MDKQPDQHCRLIEASAGPSGCLLDEGFTISANFQSQHSYANARWEISYIVDVSERQETVKIGQSDLIDVVVGSNNFQYSAAKIPIQDVAPIWLSNISLLVATLKGDSDEEILRILFVTEVLQQTGSLYRRFLSPL